MFKIEHMIRQFRVMTYDHYHVICPRAGSTSSNWKLINSTIRLKNTPPIL